MIRTLALAGLLALIAGEALATGGGGTMPYSPFLARLQASVTGEIAVLVSVIAIVGGVVGWIMGGDLGGFLFAFVRIVCGIAIITGALALVTALSTSGTSIPAPAPFHTEGHL